MNGARCTCTPLVCRMECPECGGPSGFYAGCWAAPDPVERPDRRLAQRVMELEQRVARLERRQDAGARE